MDAASKTGIDDVRELIENSKYSPTSAKFKIFIIDEVHMLSKQAFNALLKTLEEPPDHVKFILEDVLKTKGIAYYQKYPYDELAKITKNRKRHYETPDGRAVPSVTTVLSATKDMTHLHAWRKRVGAEKAQQITTESANIGTVMHRSLEKHVKGEDRKPGSNLIQQKAHTCLLYTSPSPRDS